MVSQRVRKEYIVNKSETTSIAAADDIDFQGGIAFS